MSSEDSLISGLYQEWLVDLKARFRTVQLKAAVAVNTTLLTFYWQLGGEILDRQDGQSWGSGFIRHLSHDLRVEFPEVKGFSVRNLELVRQWVTFWSSAIAQQPVSQLARLEFEKSLAASGSSFRNLDGVSTLQMRSCGPRLKPLRALSAVIPS